MFTFELKSVIPIIERLISDLSGAHGFATRDALVATLIDDPSGRQLVGRAKSKNTTSWTERQIAGNMVDWFSANYAVGGDLTQSARSSFDRTKLNRKWSYYPKGTVPTFPTPRRTPRTKAKKNAKVLAADPASTPVFTFPRTFVSYSHDSTVHRAWVERLARNLANNGVDVLLDQWDLGPSADAALYMERAVRDSDWVVVVCTDKYVAKANGGMGGAGYEKMMMTAELVRNQAKKKFIPILRTANFPTVPIFLESKIYIDFSDDNAYAESVESLLRAIHSVPRATRPSIGFNPFGPSGKGTPTVV